MLHLTALILRRIFPLFLSAFILVLHTSVVCGAAEDAASRPWALLKMQYINIFYTESAHLERLNKKIRYSPGGGSFSSFFSSTGKKNWESDFKDKINAMFEKVQRILDMRKAMRKVTIKVFGDPDDLQREYFRIFKLRDAPRAWYIFKYNTIYINVKDVNEGMLAHEMAHAVINNFMGIRLPRATTEILARYVDEHLFEEVKQY